MQISCVFEKKSVIFGHLLCTSNVTCGLQLTKLFLHICRSSSDSNQPEPIPLCSEQTIVPLNAKAKKKRKQPAKKQGKNLMLSSDSPAMGTRSKKVGGPASPAMGIRSKRRLSL